MHANFARYLTVGSWVSLFIYGTLLKVIDFGDQARTMTNLGTAFMVVGAVIFVLWFFVELRIARNKRKNKSGVLYAHPDFPSGTIVYISPRIALKYADCQIAGHVLLATMGVLSGSHSTHFVPVLLASGATEYVDDEFVSEYIDSHETAGTLPGERHGYGCRCVRCVAVLRAKR